MYPQPPIPIVTDNECAVGLANGELKIKMEKYYDATVKFRWDIEKSYDRHTEEIMHKLHLEESRLQDIEIKH